MHSLIFAEELILIQWINDTAESNIILSIIEVGFLNKYRGRIIEYLKKFAQCVIDFFQNELNKFLCVYLNHTLQINRRPY